MTNNTRFRDQLESLYGISVEIASLCDLRRFTTWPSSCLALTQSEMGFIDFLNGDRIDMDVVAGKGSLLPIRNFTSASSVCPLPPASGSFTEGRRILVRCRA